jgi:hypothetical protein
LDATGGGISSHVLADTTGLGTYHTTSGLTAGQVLRATGATTAAFQSIQAGDLPSHAHAGGDITSGAVGVAYGGTGVSSWNAGGVIYASAATTLTDTGAGAARSIIYTDDGASWEQVSASASGTYYLRVVNGVADWSAISAGALTDLTDVTITSPTTGQYLRKSAGDWVNAALNATDATAGPDDTILITRSSSVSWTTLVENDIPSLTASWTGSVVWSKVSKTGSSLADLATRAISDTTGTLAVNRGGTGKTSWNAGGLVYASASTTLSDTGAGPGQGTITYMPDSASWATLQPPATGTYMLRSANRVISWATAGTIGGSVSTTYIPYASSSNTLANSPLYRTTSTLVEGNCDMYLHSTIDHFFRMYVYGDNTNYVDGYGAGGTKGTPTATNTQWVLYLRGVGFDGAAWTTGAYIGFYAPTQWDDAPAEHSMYIQFATRQTSGALTAHWRISEAGVFHPLGTSGTHVIGASTQYLAAIYTNNVYGANHMEVATAGDSGNISINYSGYQGGTSYYRDFNVYDGKHNLIFAVDGSLHRVSIPGGHLIIDGTDSEVPEGSIGFAESGGSLYTSGRHNHYFVADNDGNSQTAVHGFYWQTNWDPPSTKMSLIYDTTASKFVLTLNDNCIYGGAGLKVVGSAASGNSNMSWVGFYANDGSTRTGYIGEGSSGDQDIRILADIGNLRLTSTSGSILMNTFTASESVRIIPSAGSYGFYNYGYQASPMFRGYRAEGTPGSESPVLTGGGLMLMEGYGWHGSNWVKGAGIHFVSAGDWTTAPYTPANMDFYTCSTSGVATHRWRIDYAGNLWPVGGHWLGNSTYPLGGLYMAGSIYWQVIKNQATSAYTTGYWYRVAQNTGSAGRGGCRIVLYGLGGSTTASTYMIEVASDWGANSSLALISAAPATGFEITKVRVVYDSVLSRKFIDVYLSATIDTNLGVQVINDSRMPGYYWSSVAWTQIGTGEPSGDEALSSELNLEYSGAAVVFGIASTAAPNSEDAFRVHKTGDLLPGADILPRTVSSEYLGSASYRWNAYLQNVIVYGQTYPGAGMYYPESSPDYRDITGSIYLNWNSGQVQALSMGAGSLTIYVDTSSNMQEGGTYHLVVFGPSSGSQTLLISGVDTWVGTSYSSKSISAGEVVSVNLIKLRSRADDADYVVGVVVLDQVTVPI